MKRDLLEGYFADHLRYPNSCESTWVSEGQKTFGYELSVTHASRRGYILLASAGDVCCTLWGGTHVLGSQYWTRCQARANVRRP